MLILKHQEFTIVAPENLALFHVQIPLTRLKMEIIFLSSYEGTNHLSTISCYKPRQTQHSSAPKGKLTMKMKFNAPSAASGP
jgi:hypothetical protein